MYPSILRKIWIDFEYLLVSLFGFYGISTILGYLKSNPLNSYILDT